MAMREMIWKRLEGAVRVFWLMLFLIVLGAFAHFLGFDLLANSIIGLVILFFVFSPFLLMFLFSREKARIDKNGNPYGRLVVGCRLLSFSAGAFWIGLPLPSLLGLDAFPNLVDSHLTDEDIAFCVVFILGGIWLVAYAWKARVCWNETDVTQTGWSLVTHSRPWDDLAEVDESDGTLNFSKHKKIQVSSFFEGQKDLIAYAKDRLDKARTT